MYRNYYLISEKSHNGLKNKVKISHLNEITEFKR